MATLSSRPHSAAFLAACMVLLIGCSPSISVSVQNQTPSTLQISLRTDRIGSRSQEFDQATLSPGMRTQLETNQAPPLEYVELAVSRTGDLSEMSTTRRVPRGSSAWTITAESDSWTGIAIQPTTSAPANQPES